ncbi:MAG: Hpt domain-containing protein [Hyphomicrobiaceae bacterium]
MATSAAASAATEAIGVVPAVDHAHLARYTFGNKALEVEVLNLFADQAPLYLTNLRDARSEKDWRDAAHTLKGSARAVGAMRVAELAERAEALRSSADMAARAMAIDALAEALDEARQHIARLEVDR